MALSPNCPLILRVAVTVAALSFFTTSIAAPAQQANALISTPLGAASVLNACPFAVHSNIVHAPRPGEVEGVKPEEIYSVLETGVEIGHSFMHDPGIGISWKLWIDDDEGPVQFEWTWRPEERRVWWDLSMIDAAGGDRDENAAVEQAVTDNGAPDYTSNMGRRGEGDLQGVPHPFAAYGMSLQPHRGGGVVELEGMCSRIDCPAGEGVCWQAYSAWNDWGKQHDCKEDLDLRVVLCG